MNFDPDNNKFVIINEKELETSLQKISADNSLSVLKKDIDKINSVIMENEGEIQPNASACSIALGAMGLYQGMTVTAAAVVLTVSAPLVFAATFAVGAVWYGGESILSIKSGRG